MNLKNNPWFLVQGLRLGVETGEEFEGEGLEMEFGEMRDESERRLRRLE